jgi:hypothetical protein
MPRAVQPGGGGGKMRVHYTARRKRGLLAASKRMMAEGMTLRAAADELRVSHVNLSKWASQGMGEIDRLDKILRSKKKAKLKARPQTSCDSCAASSVVESGNRDRRFIINMDQTPVFFSMSSKQTFEVIGKKNHPNSHVDE